MTTSKDEESSQMINDLHSTAIDDSYADSESATRKIIPLSITLYI